MGQTIAEKILAKVSGKKSLAADDIISAHVDCAMSHDNTYMFSQIFTKIGRKTVWDPQKIVIVLDHRTPANTEKTADMQKNIRLFVQQQNIAQFYDVGEGICHQLLCENGVVLPGMVIIGADSHTPTYGAFGAFAVGVGATDMAGVWATGMIWLKVPRTLHFTITGSLPSFVTAKDLMLKIIGDLGEDGATYRACEFYGDTIKHLSMDSRMCLTNQAVEMGIKTAIVPPDTTTCSYLQSKTSTPFDSVHADVDADYEKTYTVDVEHLEPQIALPHHVDRVQPVSTVTGVSIDQAVLGSCTNGRLEDLALASRILKGKTIADHVRMIVVPASRSVYQAALQKGYIQTLLQAGAIVVNPGCGPCLGLHQGVLAEGECAISSTNRNFQGRMGSSHARVYLGSPATVAASALVGEIADPREVT